MSEPLPHISLESAGAPDLDKPTAGPLPRAAKALDYARPNLPLARLRCIARQQRAVNLWMLASATAFILWAIVGAGMGVVSAAFGILFLCTFIVTVAHLGVLAATIYGSALAAVFIWLSLVPVVNVLVLLMVDERATRMLRGHGIAVGLLGADPREIPFDEGD